MGDPAARGLVAGLGLAAGLLAGSPAGSPAAAIASGIGLRNALLIPAALALVTAAAAGVMRPKS